MTSALRAASGEALRLRLADLAASVVQVHASNIAASDAFAAIGLDSLGAVELVALIEDEFEVEIPVTSLFDYPTIEDLARFMETRIAGDEVADHATANEARLARMLADAQLPPDIAPQPSGRPAGTGSVLLTGATGFMGAFILRELLAAEDKIRVRCLVRANGGNPLLRIRRNLERYGLWHPDVGARISCVEGDLEQPLLGLAAQDFGQLARSVDEIFHGAAAVDWVQPYDQLRRANVFGTRELLRLACTGSPKPFHFLSSLTVCISTHGASEVAERDAPLRDIAGLHLGYAQSKCVAEALVLAARQRGLPATIVRPALVVGDSASGASNADDLISLFIRGCIQMRAAPDLDWVMDSVPVDHAAAAVVRLGRLSGGREAVFHLANPCARSWRECVLWMRLRGYPLELLSYRAWCDRVRVTATEPSHPLFALRPFFLGTIAEVGGRSLPELYEEGHRRRVRSEQSRDVLSCLGLECPPLNATLLERYFASYVERGVLPDASSGRGGGDAARRRAGLADRLVAVLEETIRAETADAGVRVTGLTLTPMRADSSIIAELTSWRRGTSTGLYGARFTVESAARPAESRVVVVKAKPADVDAIDVGEQIARLCSRDLGEAYALWRDHIGLTRGHVRELAIYALSDDRLRRHMPKVLASWSDAAREEWVLVLEHVADATVANAVDRPWTDTEIGTALVGLAAMHSVWYGRAAELAAIPWLPPRRNARTMEAMQPLWQSAAAQARPALRQWGGDGLVDAHESLLHGIAEWWRPLETEPQTLIHNDFNPRNIMLRGRAGAQRLCAYDFELATVGAPQRDLAEFLCFALSGRAGAARAWVSRYRSLLAQATGTHIDPHAWDDGFRAALCDFLVDRLALYTMVHRFRAQTFLPGVTRTWFALHTAFPWPLP